MSQQGIFHEDRSTTFEKILRVQKTYARAGTLTSVFAEMAEEA
ncbi:MULTISPECIES: hypothetical protein [Pseudomonas]|nr:hypothetical protein [Pseudomonas sp. JL2]